MTHEEMGPFYDLYVLGALEPEERAEVEQHLARNCPDCQGGVRSALALTAGLALLPELIEPPKRLKRRVLAAIGAPDSNSGRLWLGGLGFVAACLAIAVVLIGMDRQRGADELAAVRTQLRQSTGDLVALRSALEILNQPETEQVVFGKGQPAPPRGRIFVNANRGVLLIASNLPQAPSGKAYEMWLVPKSGAPIPAGVFQTDARGNGFHLRSEPVDIKATKAVAVTLEPQAGSATPTMPLVFAAGLSD